MDKTENKEGIDKRMNYEIIIKLENLSKKYGAFKAVKGISPKIPKAGGREHPLVVGPE